MVWGIAAVAIAMWLGFWLWCERGRLLRDSTRRMVALAGWRRGLNGATIHGYFYARLTHLYVKVGAGWIAPLLGPRGKRWLANHYHGKVLPTALATELIRIDAQIPLQDLEQVIPYPLARELVLDGPTDVAAYECPCRLNSPNPCQPTQVCMVVGQPYVDFMLEHHPDISRRLTTEEAVDLLEAEHRRGHIHTAWFKEESGGRFYAICNCCSCCCGGIDAMVRLGIPMITSSGYVACVDEVVCTGCGACVETCSFGALSLPSEGERDVVQREWSACMGCGVCVDRCPTGAISLHLDPEKGIPMDVRRLADAGQ